MTNVFVYGTLKRGGRLHGAMDRANAKFVCEARTLPGEFVMRSCYNGAYPGITPADGGASVVHGEVFKVSAVGISVLDRVEGEGSLYKRTEIAVERDDFTQIKVVAYVLIHHSLLDSPLVEDGVWA